MATKIKANNYDQALKQVKAFETSNGITKGSLTAKIPKEIAKQDGKNHFHVVMLKLRHDARNKRYVATAGVQTFGKGQAFEKIKKSYKTQGFDSLIVLHDPTVKASEDETILLQHETSSIERQIEEEEKKEMERRIKERKEQAKQDAIDKKKAEEAEALRLKEEEKNKTVIVNKDNVEKLIEEHKIDVTGATSVTAKIAVVKKYLKDNK